MTIVILTPIKAEQDAIAARLTAPAEKMVEGDRYLSGSFTGIHHTFQLINQLTGSGNETLALAADKAVRRFNPQVVLLAGIAGGVKDVSVGDIVVGTKYYGYESGKVTEDGFAARPEAGYYSQELITLARSVGGSDSWRLQAKNAHSAKVVFGPIAAGNKVVAATHSDTYQLLKRAYNDTVALEMEAAGFGQAMRSHPAVRFLNIRSISDLLDGKSTSDAAGSQAWAAGNMAAFVFELLFQLDISQFKIIGNMNIKELSEQIVKMFLPLAKLDAVQEISRDFLEASNGSIGELWKKARPLFIEEYEELKKAPEDPDAQADARSRLRRELEGKDELKRELEELLQQAQKESNASGISIANSKNVIQGSQISVGGDFHLGDK